MQRNVAAQDHSPGRARRDLASPIEAASFVANRAVFAEVHRKQPLDNQGLEKAARKRPDRPNLEPICAAHGGCFQREFVWKAGLFSRAKGPREKVRRLNGGQGGIRTRGGCYTTHAFQACALNRSATCPGSAVGRSYNAVDGVGNGLSPVRLLG